MKTLFKKIIVVYQIFFPEILENKTNNLNNCGKNAYFFFGLGIIIQITFSSIFFGSILFSGEFWAESATNYFHHSKSFALQQFLILDAGYLNIVLRIISFLTNLLQIPIAIIPYFYSGISLILISLMSFIFCLPIFRIILSNDLLRFFICLILSITGGYEVKMFINFMYYASIFTLFVNAYLLTTKDKQLAWWLYSLPFVFLSKAILLAFVPIFLLSFFKINRQAKILYILCFCSTFVQVSFFSFETDHQTTISFLHKFFIYIQITSRHFTGIILNYNFLFQNTLFLYLSPLLSLFILFKILKIFFQWKSPMRFILLQGLLLIFISNFIVVAGLPGDQFNVFSNFIKNYSIMRWTILSTFATFLISFCIIEFYCQKRTQKNNRIIWFLIWISLSGNGYFIISKLFALPRSQTVSWKSNSHNTDNSSFCIAIEPYTWTYQQNCKILFENQILERTVDIKTKKNKPFYYTANIPNIIKKHTVLSIVVYYKPKINRDNHLLSLQIGDIILTQNINVRHYMIQNIKVQFTIPQSLKINNHKDISIFFDKQVISKEESIQINWYGIYEK